MPFVLQPLFRFMPFQTSRRMGQKEELQHLFEQHVLAVAVGKVTAEALKEEG